MQAIQKNLFNHGSTIMKALLFLLVVYCPFFLHLGDLPVRIWDEARLIANTLGMEKNGNYLVTYFNGLPDMWNTKPPLLIWIQLFFLKLIGNEELSFRLPSAIAGFLTILTIMLLFARHLKSYWFGLIAALVLVTANGYIGDHVVRTADYDALLTFFMTFYALCFFLFLETGKQKYLHLFFTGLALAVLTKSIQGVLFLPLLGIYLLFTGNLLRLVRNKWVYLDFTLIVILISGYYLLRESVNPGYLEAVYNNELGGRYFATTENHLQGFDFYLNLLISEQFGYWFMFLMLGFFAGLAHPKGIIRNMILYVTLLIAGYLLIISSAGTKLAWYVAPIYPLLSILAAFPIYWIFLHVIEFKGFRIRYNTYFFPAIFLISVFIVPYWNIIDKVYKPREISSETEFYLISHLLQDAVKGKTNIDGHLICFSDYNVHLTYYTDQLNEHNKNVHFIDPALVREGNSLICPQPYVAAMIKEKFLTEETGSYYTIKFLKINGTRNSNNQP
ncbi:MAG: glycosyltransferase family 39 protein [Bacteroidota bacterium]